MAMADATTFLEAARADQALAERVAQAPDEAEFFRACIEEGERLGLRFTRADLAAVLDGTEPEAVALSDEDLESIAGGGTFAAPGFVGKWSALVCVTTCVVSVPHPGHLTVTQR